MCCRSISSAPTSAPTRWSTDPPHERRQAARVDEAQHDLASAEHRCPMWETHVREGVDPRSSDLPDPNEPPDRSQHLLVSLRRRSGEPSPAVGAWCRSGRASLPTRKHRADASSGQLGIDGATEAQCRCKLVDSAGVQPGVHTSRHESPGDLGTSVRCGEGACAIKSR